MSAMNMTPILPGSRNEAAPFWPTSAPYMPPPMAAMRTHQQALQQLQKLAAIAGRS